MKNEVSTDEEEKDIRKQFKGLPTFIALKVSTKADLQRIIMILLNMPYIENVFEVTGNYDIIVTARTKTSSNLNTTIKAIRAVPGVIDTYSYLALNEYSKEDDKQW